MFKVFTLLIASLISVTPVAEPALFIKAAIVADDEKLPVNIQAFSTKGNPANFPGGYTITISDPTLGTWLPRAAADPPSIEGYFVPIGPLGEANLVVSGTNSRGIVVTSTLAITIVGGAATSIQITPLAPVINIFP